MVVYNGKVINCSSNTNNIKGLLFLSIVSQNKIKTSKNSVDILKEETFSPHILHNKNGNEYIMWDSNIVG